LLGSEVAPTPSNCWGYVLEIIRSSLIAFESSTLSVSRGSSLTSF
jgi:hypothetical protein